MLNHENNVNAIPSVKKMQILALNSGGEPLGWVDYEECVKQKTKNNILWTIGQNEIVLRGGTNSKTGLRSTMTLESIIALKYAGTKAKKGREYRPHLSNPALFNRDRHMCAYCGHVYSGSKLTRDHVQPQSKNGPDIWENVVTACTRCNQRKADRVLGDPMIEDMKLLYVPYAPSFHEHLILENRHILIDQMEFLLKGVGRHSKLHDEYKEMLERQQDIQVNA